MKEKILNFDFKEIEQNEQIYEINVNNFYKFYNKIINSIVKLNKDFWNDSDVSAKLNIKNILSRFHEITKQEESIIYMMLFYEFVMDVYKRTSHILTNKQMEYNSSSVLKKIINLITKKQIYSDKDITKIIVSNFKTNSRKKINRLVFVSDL
ncbi:MAG: hypothetical protein N2505_00200 [Endomicrobia bacterium]|nr:hypothetical protein [Endomicrobiia bacterium]